jgi:anaerobic selenocysteine-containing dehydrogenase
VAHLAHHTLGETSPVDWLHLVADYDRIRDLVAAVIPGFERYAERIRDRDGFVLPNSAGAREWRTQSGRAEFTVHAIPHIELAEGQYLMATVRSHDQYNTTIYGLDDRYRGIFGERRVVMMNPEDIDEAGLKEGQVVDLTSHFEDGERHAPRFVVVQQNIPRKCVFTYFPEANPLVPARSVAKLSNTPTSKSVVISMRPS